MKRCVAIFCLVFAGAGGILFGQKAAVDSTQRYYRLICLVHLKGSGKAGDPVLPEYVAEGTAVAQAAFTSAIAASAIATTAAPGKTGNAAAAAPAAGARTSGSQPVPASVSASVSASAPPVPRPGILAWSMQQSDDGKMAIIHMVAADRGAFAAILADTRPEIKVFQIGKDSPEAIEKEMRKYKKDFSLATFEVPVQ